MRVFLIFLLLSSLSCRSPLEEEVKIIRVDLNAPLDSAAFRNKISGIRFIPLETNGRSLIGKIDKCMINEEGIYILDGREQAVHRFDRDGRYLNTLHKPGRDPGEYVAITDISFTDRYELAVLDGGENQVLYYDSLFQYIRTLSVEGGDKLMSLPAQELVIYKDNPRLEEYGLIHYDGMGA